MRIINLLNTNIRGPLLTESQLEPVKPKQLQALLNSNLDNKFAEPVYLGEGINGALYKLTESTRNKPPTSADGEYICKVIPYNPAYLKQLKKELGLLKTIQLHPYIREFINPCLGMFILANQIVSIFPVFNGLTLDNVIAIVNKPDFTHSNRITLLKYIILDILEALYFFHKQGVSHLQIDGSSILIEMQPPKATNLMRERRSAKQPESFNDNSESSNSKVNPFVPTNSDIYIPEFTEADKPLRIKFTNFGTGCGKLIELDETGNNARPFFQSCKTINYNADPYISSFLANPINKTGVLKTNSRQLALAKKYDIWLMGKLVLKLITKPGTDLTTPANINNDTLLDESFKHYLGYLKKYMLCPLKTRRNSKFVQEMFILSDKHDNSN